MLRLGPAGLRDNPQPGGSWRRRIGPSSGASDGEERAGNRRDVGCSSGSWPWRSSLDGRDRGPLPTASNPADFTTRRAMVIELVGGPHDGLRLTVPDGATGLLVRDRPGKEPHVHVGTWLPGDLGPGVSAYLYTFGKTKKGLPVFRTQGDRRS